MFSLYRNVWIIFTLALFFLACDTKTTHRSASMYDFAFYDDSEADAIVDKALSMQAVPDYNKMREALQGTAAQVETRIEIVKAGKSMEDKTTDKKVQADVHMLWVLDASDSMNDDIPAVSEGLVGLVNHVNQDMTHLKPNVLLLSDYFGEYLNKNPKDLLDGVPGKPAVPGEWVEIPAKPAKERECREIIPAKPAGQKCTDPIPAVPASKKCEKAKPAVPASKKCTDPIPAVPAKEAVCTITPGVPAKPERFRKTEKEVKEKYEDKKKRKQDELDKYLLEHPFAKEETDEKVKDWKAKIAEWQQKIDNCCSKEERGYIPAQDAIEEKEHCTDPVPAVPAVPEKCVDIPAVPAVPKKCVDIPAVPAVPEKCVDVPAKEAVESCTEAQEAVPASKKWVEGKEAEPGKPHSPGNKEKYDTITKMLPKFKTTGIRVKRVYVDTFEALTEAHHHFQDAGFKKGDINVVVVVTDDCDKLTSEEFMSKFRVYKEKDNITFFGFIDKIMDWQGAELDEVRKKLKPCAKGTYAKTAIATGGEVFDVLSLNPKLQKPTMSWSAAFQSIKAHLKTIEQVIQVPVSYPIKTFALGSVEELISVSHKTATSTTLLTPAQYTYDDATLTINADINIGDSIVIEFTSM